MSDWVPQSDPRHPGEDPVLAARDAFQAAVDAALADQAARNAQAAAFQSDVHSGDGHTLNAGPRPNEGS
jgi:hypothetical protein